MLHGSKVDFTSCNFAVLASLMQQTLNSVKIVYFPPLLHNILLIPYTILYYTNILLISGVVEKSVKILTFRKSLKNKNPLNFAKYFDEITRCKLFMKSLPERM